MEHAFYDKLVFSGVKETLGFDRIRFMVTAPAPISDECLILLRVIFGCPVIQGPGASARRAAASAARTCTTWPPWATAGGIICCAEARVGVGRAP